MICPYCTTEIEPIELNGKLFCSNCGLSIGSSKQEIQAPPKITPLNNPISDKLPSPGDEQKTEKLQSAAKPSEPTITELIKAPTTGIKLQDEENTSTPMSPQSNPNEGSTQVSTTVVESKKARTLEVTENVGKTKQADINKDAEIHDPISPSTIEKKGLLLDILDDKNDSIRTLSADELRPKDDHFSENVKNIDTLGASGILLDILSDEAVVKTNENNKGALEAATDLIDKIKPANISKTEIEEKPQAFIPKNGKKLKVDILESSPVNPTLHPAIEAADEELDLPTPEETERENDKIEQAAENLPKETEPIKEEIISEVEENELDQKVKAVFEDEHKEDIDMSDLPSVKEKEKGGKRNKAHILNDEISEEQRKVPSKPKVGLSAESSSHLTNYFSHIVEGDKKGKKTKTKTPKSHLILYILLVILLVTAFGILIYFYLQEF